MYICTFTGHRPSYFKFGYDEKYPLCKAIKRVIFEQCVRLYKDEAVRTFYSGCALGVDLWGAEIVLYLKEQGYSDISLICAVPYPNHDSKWTDNQKQRLNRIIRDADELVTICDNFSNDSYKKRNYYMIDHSQFLLAVFDQQKNHRSGTQQTVNYAQRKKLNIVYIHPDTAKVSK